jgi:hypothetical protein
MAGRQEWLAYGCGWTTLMAGRREWLDDVNGWTMGMAGHREWLEVTNKMGLVQNSRFSSNFRMFADSRL